MYEVEDFKTIEKYHKTIDDLFEQNEQFYTKDIFNMSEWELNKRRREINDYYKMTKDIIYSLINEIEQGQVKNNE